MLRRWEIVTLKGTKKIGMNLLIGWGGGRKSFSDRPSGGGGEKKLKARKQGRESIGRNPVESPRARRTFLEEEAREERAYRRTHTHP